VVYLRGSTKSRYEGNLTEEVRIRISKEEKEELRTLAAEQEMSVSELMRQLFRRFFLEHPIQR